MKIPLGEVTDEQLLAEVARRKLDLHNQITDALVKESYTFDGIFSCLHTYIHTCIHIYIHI